MAIELATAYVSIVPETTKLESGLKNAFNGVGKQADRAGSEMGSRLAKTASKALKDGWRPDQDIMAGIPNTKLDRIGANIGRVIGKGVVAGLKAQQIGRDFGSSFAQGAGSIGLGSVVSGWRRDLKDQPHKLGYLAGKGISAGLQAGMLGATAIIGTALKTGFDRLVTLDTAQYKLRQVLKTQGKGVAEYEKINKAVQAAVDKTPFSLDQAFGTAVQAIGAGASDIERFMKNVADAAGFAGTDMARMGLIFNQVLAKGKLTGEETMQLMEAGLPAASWIQDSYDLTVEQYADMQEKGEITLDMLQKSIEDHAPGMAKALGNTLQGSIDNMQTSLARTGANFLAAVFGGPTGDPTEGLKSAVQRVTDMLNRLNEWIIANKDNIRNFFESARDAAGKVVEVLGKISTFLGEHPGLIQAVVVAFAAWKTISAVSNLVTTLGNISNLLGVGLPASATKGATGIAAALAKIPVPAWLMFLVAGNSNAIEEWIRDKTGIPTHTDSFNDVQGRVNAELGITSGTGNNTGLKQNAISLKDSIAAAFPEIRDIGGYRPNDPYPDHPSGRALDVMIPPELVGTPAGKALGDRINDFALKSGLAQYTMWEQKQFNAGGGFTGMEDRGSPTQNHFDHVHIYTNMGAPEVLKGAIPTIGPVTGGSPQGSKLLERLAGIGTYDTGGWLPPGTTTVTNATGKPELILNPEQQKNLTDMGIDPNSLLHGSGGGAAPGPVPHGMSGGAAPGPSAAPSAAMTGEQSNPGMDFIRSMGFIPAAAGNTGVAGTSSLASFIGMGNEVVSGVIDTGVNLANQAVSAAIAAAAAGGGFGGGAAAAPFAQMAASYGIQLLGNQAKRISAYGFQMASIAADAGLEIMSPFGLPRWLGYDYTGFAPQLGIQQALTSSVERMGADAISKAFPQPGMAGPDPSAAQATPPPPPAVGSPQPTANTDPSGPSQEPPAPTMPIPMLPIPGLFDEGGMLPPGGLAVNMTSRPEPVLTPQQWDAIAASSMEPARNAPLVENLYAQDMQDAIRKLEQTRRRDMMQYAGRP